MKVSELISILEKLQENYGPDHKIKISVRDYYTVYGHYGSIELLSTNGAIWSGISTNGNQTLLDVWLDNEVEGDEIKYPKVTFRKQS